jgi:hypothetical protein
LSYILKGGDFIPRSIQRITNILLLSFTGIKNSGTILGSHEWHFEKLENFASTL